MTSDEKFLALFKTLEDDITAAQEFIDQTRAEHPYDNVIQYVMDQQQTVLDRDKLRAQKLKEEYSRISM